MTNRMSVAFRSFSELLSLSTKNLWRWRYRALAVAGLVAVAFSLYVLYGALLVTNGQKGMAEIKALSLPADMVVVARGDALGKTAAQFEKPKYNRRIMEHGEEAVALTTYSRLGELEILGVQLSTPFFSAEKIGLIGQPLTRPGDLLLPQALAESKQIKIGDKLTLAALERSSGAYQEAAFTVVGTINPSYELVQPLALRDDLYVLRGRATPNRFLIQKYSDCDLSYLVEWMSTVFPQHTLLSAYTPRTLGQRIIADMYQPGKQVLAMVYLFMGIGVLSIALITFLERRRELAVLKTLGVSNRQTALVLGSEQALSGVLGLGVGYAVIRVLGQRLSWMSQLDPATLRGLLLQGTVLTIAVLALSAWFPTLTAKVATVNQLLFSRTIPIVTEKTDRLMRPYPWLLEREQQEGVRLLRLDVVDGILEGIQLKSTGDRVKRGEVVATQSTLFGLKYREWCSPVDGQIIDYNAASGYMVFKPYEQMKKAAGDAEVAE